VFVCYLTAALPYTMLHCISLPTKSCSIIFPSTQRCMVYGWLKPHITKLELQQVYECCHFWDENGMDISFTASFSTFDLLEFVFVDKSETGTKYGMPNLKTGWKRFRCYPDRFLLFQFLFRISHFLRDLLYFICLKYWFYSGDGFWPSDCFERSKSINSCFCTPQS